MDIIYDIDNEWFKKMQKKISSKWSVQDDSGQRMDLRSSMTSSSSL